MAIIFAKYLKLNVPIKENTWAKYTELKKDTENAYKTLLRRSRGKMPVKRPGIELRGNTKLILRE
jgi:hypothetical protein